MIALESVLFVIFGNYFLGRTWGSTFITRAPTPSLPFLEQRWGQIRPDIQQADDYN